MIVAASGRVGARGTDSVALLTATSAAALRAAGVEFALQYLGSVTQAGVQAILAAGLGFMPVTYADRFSGDSAVAALRALALPGGVTAWLDVEGVATTDPAALQAQINEWATKVLAAGFEPGLYVGAGCPLTSVELYRLKVVRYWKSASKIIDRNGQLAEPACGWCMAQLFPSLSYAGVWVDLDVVQQDYRNRLPTWAVQG